MESTIIPAPEPNLAGAPRSALHDSGGNRAPAREPSEDGTPIEPAHRPRLTLGHIFALALLGLAALPALLFLVARAGRDAVLESSTRLRQGAAREVAGRIDAYLDRAPDAVVDFEASVRAGLVGADNPLAVESALFGRLLVEPSLSELTFTYAPPDSGPGTPFQVALLRIPSGEGERLVTWRIEPRDGVWRARLRLRPPGGSLTSAPLAEVRCERPADDPRAEPTFATPASEAFRGRTLWSDLHLSRLPWSDLGDGLPPEAPAGLSPEAEVVVSAQRAVLDAEGRVLGVARAGLRAAALDHLVRLAVGPEALPDPHHVFLFDAAARALVTRPGPRARHVLVEGAAGKELRVPVVEAAAEIGKAIEAFHAATGGASADHVRFASAGTTYIGSARPLGGGRGWSVGVVAPESFYLGDLAAELRRWTAVSLSLLVLAAAGGLLVLGVVRRSLGGLTEEAARLERLDFAPRPSDSPFAELAAVRGGLEGAKAGLRAMGRYAPLELVRTLFRSRREPELGGVVRELSILFSDIEGFTALCETMPPDRLARALGIYFERMTAAIHAQQGTIDKYIGDAVMAIWNAPSPVEGHARAACQAALACQRALEELFASPAWEGLPPFRTRFGVHTAEVLVGHFGAPDRMSYTALGDGVNVAARFEGLNKVYGTRVLVSQAVYDQAKGELCFRLIDRVAVKGRQGGLNIYELLGRKGEGREELALEYEDALALYFQRAFVRARVKFEAHPDDGPSRALAARCRTLVEHPPPMDWDGVNVAQTK